MFARLFSWGRSALSLWSLVPSTWVVVAGLAAVSAIGIGWQEWQKRELRLELAESRAAFAVLERDFATVEANRDHLRGEIERQNAEIGRLRVSAEAAASEARARALAALRLRERGREAINRAGKGPEELNQWLRDTFTGLSSP